MAVFVEQCPYCMDGKARMLKLRPPRGVVHSTEVRGMIHFDFLPIKTSGPLGGNSVGGWPASTFSLFLRA